MESSAEVIRMARELNPGIRVLARAAYLRDRAHTELFGESPTTGTAIA